MNLFRQNWLPMGKWPHVVQPIACHPYPNYRVPWHSGVMSLFAYADWNIDNAEASRLTNHRSLPCWYITSSFQFIEKWYVNFEIPFVKLILFDTCSYDECVEFGHYSPSYCTTFLVVSTYVLSSCIKTLIRKNCDKILVKWSNSN